MSKTVLFALAVATAGAALAQARPPEPADASIKGPPLQYRSVFEDYRPFTEQEVGSWRKANEEVAAVGGHKGHLPKPAAGEPQKPPPARDHGGHK